VIVTNTLAYCAMELTTTVERIALQAQNQCCVTLLVVNCTNVL